MDKNLKEKPICEKRQPKCTETTNGDARYLYFYIPIRDFVLYADLNEPNVIRGELQYPPEMEEFSERDLIRQNGAGLDLRINHKAFDDTTAFINYAVPAFDPERLYVSYKLKSKQVPIKRDGSCEVTQFLNKFNYVRRQQNAFFEILERMGRP